MEMALMRAADVEIKHHLRKYQLRARDNYMLNRIPPEAFPEGPLALVGGRPPLRYRG